MTVKYLLFQVVCGYWIQSGNETHFIKKGRFLLNLSSTKAKGCNTTPLNGLKFKNNTQYKNTGYGQTKKGWRKDRLHT